MNRLVRLIDDSDPSEDVMILGGERGIVALHLPGGCPDWMALHSPVEHPGWTGPCPCRRLEGMCWCLGSIRGGELRATLPAGWELLGDEGLWALMEDVYRLYLEGARR